MDSSSISGPIRGHTNIYKGTSLLVFPLSVQGLESVLNPQQKALTTGPSTFRFGELTM